MKGEFSFACTSVTVVSSLAVTPSLSQEIKPAITNNTPVIPNAKCLTLFLIFIL